MKILISGATGSVGSELARTLSQRGVGFQALVRSPERAGALAGLPDVELVGGDFGDEASLARALTGVERAFLLTPSTAEAEAQQLRFVAVAKRQGVRHLVKLSQWAANARSPVRFLRYHAIVEAAIRESGLEYTFLRPNLFMQGLLAFRDAIAHQGQFFASAGAARVSVVDVRDIAAAAAAALLDPRHAGQTYDLTGPEALTHAEMAAQLTAALGRPVQFVDLPEEAMRGALAGTGMPSWQVDGLVEDYAHYRRDEAAVVATGVKDATGKAPRSFADFARDYAPAFAAT